MSMISVIFGEISILTCGKKQFHLITLFFDNLVVLFVGVLAISSQDYCSESLCEGSQHIACNNSGVNSIFMTVSFN